MSQENVDRVRAAYAAFNRADVEAVRGLLHPDVEWHPYLGAIDGSVYRGREAVIRMWSDLAEGFGGTLRVEILELVDLGERVLAVIEAHAVGSGSGAEVRHRWAQLATLREGLVVRVDPFADREAALAAAGEAR